MEDIERVLVKRLEAAGNPLMERGDDVHFIVRAASAAEAAASGAASEFVLDDPARAVHDMHIAPNSCIELVGSFKLQRFVDNMDHQVPKLCQRFR